MKKLEPIESLSRLIQEYKQKNLTVGFLSGGFDLIHNGHVVFIQEAKRHVDILIVGIHNDETMKATKGILRPILSAEQRATILTEFESINHVFIIPEVVDMKSPAVAAYYDRIIERIHPTIIFTNTLASGDKNKKDNDSREKKYNVQFINLKQGDLNHSTDIITRIKNTNEHFYDLGEDKK